MVSGDGGADGEHQPVGGGVQDKSNLIGQRRAATGAVGGKLGLVRRNWRVGCDFHAEATLRRAFGFAFFYAAVTL